MRGKIIKLGEGVKNRVKEEGKRGRCMKIRTRKGRKKNKEGLEGVRREGRKKSG